MNKAVLYVSAFKQMLQDFKKKDFGDDKQIAVNKTVKNEKKGVFNRQKMGEMSS